MFVYFLLYYITNILIPGPSQLIRSLYNYCKCIHHTTQYNIIILNTRHSVRYTILIWLPSFNYVFKTKFFFIKKKIKMFSFQYDYYYLKYERRYYYNLPTTVISILLPFWFSYISRSIFLRIYMVDGTSKTRENIVRPLNVHFNDTFI